MQTATEATPDYAAMSLEDLRSAYANKKGQWDSIDRTKEAARNLDYELQTASHDFRRADGMEKMTEQRNRVITLMDQLTAARLAAATAEEFQTSEFRKELREFRKALSIRLAEQLFPEQPRENKMRVAAYRTLIKDFDDQAMRLEYHCDDRDKFIADGQGESWLKKAKAEAAALFEMASLIRQAKCLYSSDDVDTLNGALQQAAIAIEPLLSANPAEWGNVENFA